MKKNFKRLLALGLVATMVAGMAVGCGSKKSGSKGDKVELVMSVWDSDQQPVMDEMGKKYTESHPNVTVRTQLSPWSEYWTKLETSAVGGDGADILTMNILHVEEYAEAGILMDLTDAEAKSDLKIRDNFPTSLVDGYTVEGKLYGIPKDFDTNAIFYNKEIFDAAGVEYPSDDMTFEDFRALCEELQASPTLPEGVYPTAINRNSGQTTYEATIYANGGWLLNEDNTESGWGDPKTIGGVQPWLDMVLDGISPTLEQMADVDPDSMFQGGKLAMYLSGNYMIPSYKETLEGKIGIAKLPTFNGKGTNILNGLAYTVSAGTKHPEEAIDFALWLGSKEAMEIQGKSGTVISARNDCQELYLDTHKDLNLQVFLDNVPESVLFSHCKVQSELGQASKPFLEEAWKGTMTLEEAGKKAAEAQNAVLEKMNAK